MVYIILRLGRAFTFLLLDGKGKAVQGFTADILKITPNTTTLTTEHP